MGALRDMRDAGLGTPGVSPFPGVRDHVPGPCAGAQRSTPALESAPAHPTGPEMTYEHAPTGVTSTAPELHDVLGWSPVPTLLVSEGGIVRFANRAAEDLLSHGVTLFGARLFPEDAADEGSAAIGRAIVALSGRETGAQDRLELVWDHVDGYQLWLDVRLVHVAVGPVDAGVLVHLEDVTPIRDAAAALAAAEEEIRTSFAAAPIGMALVSTDGWLLKANRALARLVGRSEHHLLATRLVDLVDGDATPELLDTLLGCRHTDPVIVLFRGPDGPRSVRYSARPVFGADGSPRHLIVQLEDVTVQLAAQEELRAAVLDLERSNEDLEAFAHVAAHDLRAPVASIRGMIEAVRLTSRGELSDRVDHFLQRAIDGTMRMDRLVTDLLAFARLGRGDAEMGDVDLATVVGDVLAGLEGVISERGAIVDVDDLPVLHGNRLQLQQLLQNLIGNGLKFSPPDVAPRVEVLAEQLGNTWEIRVADHGIGIPEESREQVFAPFERLHGRDSYEGTGVGLAICGRVAEAHGGSIHVEETFGGGATFVVRLPQPDPDRAPSR